MEIYFRLIVFYIISSIRHVLAFFDYSMCKRKRVLLKRLALKNQFSLVCKENAHVTLFLGSKGSLLASKILSVLLGISVIHTKVIFESEIKVIEIKKFW